MKSTTNPRPTVRLDGFADLKLRYRVPKGRVIKKTERPTYDRATAAMLAGLIYAWTVYEDGWVFVLDAAGTETPALSLAEAGAFLTGLTAGLVLAA